MLALEETPLLSIGLSCACEAGGLSAPCCPGGGMGLG